MHLNLQKEEVHHNDEHDLDIYFGPSSPHAFEGSIPIDFFHDPSYDLTLDVSMVFIDGSSPFIPLMDCNL